MAWSLFSKKGEGKTGDKQGVFWDGSHPQSGIITILLGNDKIAFDLNQYDDYGNKEEFPYTPKEVRELQTNLMAYMGMTEAQNLYGSMIALEPQTEGAEHRFLRIPLEVNSDYCRDRWEEGFYEKGKICISNPHVILTSDFYGLNVRFFLGKKFPRMDEYSSFKDPYDYGRFYVMRELEATLRQQAFEYTNGGMNLLGQIHEEIQADRPGLSEETLQKETFRETVRELLQDRWKSGPWTALKVQAKQGVMNFEPQSGTGYTKQMDARLRALGLKDEEMGVINEAVTPVAWEMIARQRVHLSKVLEIVEMCEMKGQEETAESARDKYLGIFHRNEAVLSCLRDAYLTSLRGAQKRDPVSLGMNRGPAPKTQKRQQEGPST